MKLLKYITLVSVFTLFSFYTYAANCDDIKMDSSVNIVKKLKCKAGSDSGATETSSSENKSEGTGWKLWKKPEWMKKKN